MRRQSMNETQRKIVAAVKARGYLEGWTPSELGARQFAKLVEEVGEVGGACSIQGGMAAEHVYADLYWAASSAREAFDDGYCGEVLSPETAAEEAADCYVVLSVLTHALEQMLGREIDLEALALAKAQGDVKRGVR
jgi:NTP pyrophosphatase (non-canonical NTP hydrolase)